MHLTTEPEPELERRTEPPHTTNKGTNMKALTILLVSLTLSTGAFGDVERGQTYYLKFLRPHFKYNGQVFAQQHLKIEWKRYFKNDAEKFIKKYSKKHPEAQQFLSSDKFQKIAPHIQDFATKYAADSGELPSCD